MTAFVALIRAVNVSGTGKLPKDDLKAMGEACGFDRVCTFINSGNLLFGSNESEARVRQSIESRLADCFDRPVSAFVRSAAEMAEASRRNPFTDDKGSRVMAHFIDAEPTQAMIGEARDIQGERLALGPRLLYVSYDEGIGKTRLKLPAVKQGTARNMNSVGKIAQILADME